MKMDGVSAQYSSSNLFILKCGFFVGGNAFSKIGGKGDSRTRKLAHENRCHNVAWISQSEFDPRTFLELSHLNPVINLLGGMYIHFGLAECRHSDDHS